MHILYLFYIYVYMFECTYDGISSSLCYICIHVYIIIYILYLGLYVFHMLYVCIYDGVPIVHVVYVYICIHMNVIHMFICMKCIYVYMMACPSSLRPMGWLRLGGSLKLLVSFAKEPYKRMIFCKRDVQF